MSCLKSSRYRALDGSIRLWRIRCRKLATNSEAIAEVHEYTVRVLCAVVSAERAWDSHIYHEAFHDRKNGGRARAPYGRCRREALSTNITTYRDPREKLGKVQRCRCGQVPAVASLASSRDVEWVPDSLSPENKPNMKPIPRSSGSHAVSLSISAHSHGRGQGKRVSG